MYLVANVRETRCPEMTQNGSDDGLPSVIVAFNKELLPSIRKVQINPIKLDEIQDFRAASGPVAHPYWQSPPSRELLAGCQKLRVGATGAAFTSEQRKGFSWTAQLTDYLAQLESWQPGNEDAS